MLSIIFSGPARGQAQVPPARNQTPAAVVVADPRAQLWGATARYVYADDPDLAKVRAELIETVDDTNLKAFARSLDDAVGVESRQLPRQNHVLKLQGIFKEVQAQNLNPTDLTGLVNAIRTKLQSNPARMSDPARRQRLADFLAQLNQAAVTPDAAAALATPAAGVSAGPQLGPADTASLPAVAPAGAVAPGTAPATAASTLPLISLILSALSLLGVLFLLLTRNRAAPPAYRPEPEPAPSRKTSDLLFSTSQYQELKRLVQQEVAASMAGQLPAAPQAPAPRIAAPAPAAAPVAAARPAPSPPAPVPPAPPAPPAVPPPSLSELMAEPTPAGPRLRTIYVNQQPLDGAFRRDNLADAPASYTIFEITVEEQSTDYGTFVVTRNEAAHGGYIGSHHSILEPACVYNYPQGPVSRIITDTPGTVQRLPSGDWHISQKARIHFV